MTWVIGNLQDCHPIEIFDNALRTPAPVTGTSYRQQPNADGETHVPMSDEDLDEVEGTVPRALEA